MRHRVAKAPRASSEFDAPGSHDSLVESGVEILRAPAPSPFGLTFTFVDPDGYAVTIHDAD